MLVVAVGFAHHLPVLGTVAFERRREIAGHAVRAGYLLAQQAGLLLGFVEQLVPGVDLTRQTADPLFGGRAALLELGDLLLLGGDPLFEGRDDLFLRLDAAVVLGGGRKGEEQEDEGQCAEGSHGVLFGGFGAFGGLFQPQFDLSGVVALFEGAFPVDFGHELFAQLVKDIAVVDHQFGTLLPVERHGLL